MIDATVLDDGRPKALLGRHGWLFLCNAPTVGQLLGRIALEPHQHEEYRAAFTARWERFEDLGVPYLFLPVPMKELVYRELLPEGFEIAATDLPVDRLLAMFESDPRVEIEDLRPRMRDARLEADVYFRTDTHLSAIGGHCLYRAIAGHRASRRLGIEPRPITDFPVRIEAPFQAGLAHQEKVSLIDDSLVPSGPADADGYDEIAVLSDEREIYAGLSPPAEAPSSYEGFKEPTRILQWPDRRDLPSAVVVGDSFMDRVLPYLIGHFRRLVCIWAPNPPFSVIERERPDLVIQLIAERFLIRSPLMPGWELVSPRPVGFEPTMPR